MDEGVSIARVEGQPDERFVPLRRQLGVTSFGINQIYMLPRQRGRIHRHRGQEEVYLVLDGTLTIIIEGEARQLFRGEMIRIAPNLKRQLVNASETPLSLLALGGEGEHRGRDGEAFTSWDQEVGAPPQEVPPPEDLPTG
jgi:mannose-6-phosphate isomerase-like protein (cupin superfamily)